MCAKLVLDFFFLHFLVENATSTSDAVIYRVLTVHGSMDKIVPVEDAMEFAKFIPNHKLHIIEGADHEYTSNQDELASIVVDFVKTRFCQGRDVSEQLSSCIRVDRSIQSRLW